MDRQTKRPSLTVRWLAVIAPAILAFATVTPGPAFARVGVTARGEVRDTAGTPVAQATVIVYAAHVRQGYNVFCPTCWLDCGKRVVTDASGNYAIDDLDPALKFRLLVLKPGYAATFIRNVDPAAGAAPTAKLAVRMPIDDMAKVMRGHIEDDSGQPVADAIVEPKGVTTDGPDGRRMAIGSQGWIDSMAVSDGHGDFEIAYGRPANQMLLKVSARGKAPELVDARTGADRQTVTLRDGATVGGRLLGANGHAVAGADVVLVLHNETNGKDFGDISVGTRDDGSFAIPNVPAAQIWTLYVRMESLATRNLALEPLLLETAADGRNVALGNVRLRGGYSLAGRVLSSSGAAAPDGTTIMLVAEHGDVQRAVTAPDGEFAFKGLATGVYSIIPAVADRADLADSSREILVDRDRSDIVVRIDSHPTK